MTAEEREHDQEPDAQVLAEEDKLEEFSEAQALLRPFGELPLKISIELGRSALKISDMLALGFHSIVELDKPVGNNLDIFVNSVFLGRGEVVIIEDKVGIKINELADHCS